MPGSTSNRCPRCIIDDRNGGSRRNALGVADGRWPITFAEMAIRQALKAGRPPPLPPLRRRVAKKLKLIR
jgi:hypothetical protein